MLKKANIAVLVSGGGTNLEALLKAQESGMIPHGEIVLVCASNETAYALTRAADHGVPGVAIPRKQMDQAAFEAALSAKLEEYKIDVIVLAGFLSILSTDFVRRWPDRIINVHPSLIPSFCGKGMYGLKVHEAALEKGGVDEHDMFNTFNMGVGMIVIVPKEDVEKAIEALDCGAYVIGEIVEGDERVVLC